MKFLAYMFVIFVFITAVFFLCIFDIPISSQKQSKKKNNLWTQPDHSYHFDEDPDMHEVDEDGYCYECDEYEEDMR